jgi:hypothetical protein
VRPPDQHFVKKLADILDIERREIFAAAAIIPDDVSATINANASILLDFLISLAESPPEQKALLMEEVRKISQKRFR